MERYYGKVGYVVTKMDPEHRGVYIDESTERYYYGDVIKNRSRWEASGNLNDNLRIGQRISIIADAYACQNFSAIKYVEWMGVKWKVTTVEPERPRLILTLGGEYNA